MTSSQKTSHKFNGVNLRVSKVSHDLNRHAFVPGRPKTNPNKQHHKDQEVIQTSPQSSLKSTSQGLVIKAGGKVCLNILWNIVKSIIKNGKNMEQLLLCLKEAISQKKAIKREERATAQKQSTGQPQPQSSGASWESDEPCEIPFELYQKAWWRLTKHVQRFFFFFNLV